MSTTRSVLPGVYPTYNADRRTVVPPSPGVVVALPIVHNWGPVNDPQMCVTFDDFEAKFGTDDSPGRIAVEGALKGEGLEGLGGAGAVLVDRFASATAAEASITLQNPAAQDAFTIDAIYTGTRGNRLVADVGAVVNGVQEVTLLDGTVELETYSYRIADAGALAGLAASFARSDFTRGTVVAEGVTGLQVGTFPLVGGNDGAVLTGADWTNQITAFNDFDFALIAPYDLPWAQGVPAQSVRDTVSSLIAWRDEQEDSYGHRVTLVIGGALDELPADAIARATGISNPGVITTGGPGFDDDTYGALSSSQMAPRYAGIRAQRGEHAATHMARIAGGTPRPLPTGARVALSDLVSLTEAGVVTWTRDRWAVAPTRIVKDVNTYAPDVDDPETEPVDRPAAVWGNPKFVLSMQQFANEAQAELERDMIGKVNVNDTTRAAGAARVLRMAKDRERIGAFNPGTVVNPVAGADTDDFIIVQVSLVFGRSLAQLFLKATVR